MTLTFLQCNNDCGDGSDEEGCRTCTCTHVNIEDMLLGNEKAKVELLLPYRGRVMLMWLVE